MVDSRKFFNDYLNIKKILEDKREYHAMMARVEALPKDYRYVYKKITDYMWKFVSGSGMEMLKMQEDLVELFEQGAADGKPVLEVTGEDVAAFADELLKETDTYAGKLGKNPNKDIENKLKN